MHAFKVFKNLSSCLDQYSGLMEFIGLLIAIIALFYL